MGKNEGNRLMSGPNDRNASRVANQAWYNGTVVRAVKTNYVPYTGATKDLDLGTNKLLLADKIVMTVSQDQLLEIHGGQSPGAYRSTFVGGVSAPAFTGNRSVGIGWGSLAAAGAANYTVAIGAESLKSVTTGVENTGVGSSVMNATTTGSQNTALGEAALGTNITGSGNTAVGFRSGFTYQPPGGTADADTYCTYVGNFAKRNSNTPIGAITNSSAFGNDAEVTESNQVVLGNSAVKQVLVGKVPVASYGSDASRPNVIIGVNSGKNITTGGDLQIVGRESGRTLTTQRSTVIFGFSCLQEYTDLVPGDFGATKITCIGSGVFQKLETGTGNIGIGDASGLFTTTLNNSIFIGKNCAWYSNGSTGLTLIGNEAKLATNNSGVSNSSALGASAQITRSNQVMLGNSSVDEVTMAKSGAGIVLKSPDGTEYKLTIANGGTVTVTPV